MPPPSLSFTISPRSLAKPFDAASARLDSAQFTSSLWSRRGSTSGPQTPVRQLIANRLGWLTALDFVSPLALMGAGALAGRDKLSLWVPPQLQSLSLWVEQLVAESTGKHGKGVVPITGEPEPTDVDLGDDRVVVGLSVGAQKAPGFTVSRSREGCAPIDTSNNTSCRFPRLTAARAGLD